jgi:maltoporin
MRNFVKFSVLAILAVSASVASAADLEFHGYARVGLGMNSKGGNQIAFMMNEDGKSKFRLGNEADWVLEPGFTMSFTKLDDKSAWGVHMLPAMYRRFNDDRAGLYGEDGGTPISYKEFYFYGQNVPQLGGGEIWVGRRYFGRVYLGAINDSFLEAQDGVGAGVYNIPVGPAKLNIDLAAPDTLNNGGAAADQKYSLGVHVAGIPTFNKDSSLQAMGRVYWSSQNKDVVGDNTRKIGFSISAKADNSFGSAGTLTIAGRYNTNAYTDQQDNGGSGVQKYEIDAVYGVNVPSARTSIDVLVAYLGHKAVAANKDDADPSGDTTRLILAGFRTDTQISGPFRFLLEVGYGNGKTGDADANTLLKVTPCFAISGGNDPWSRPTFRLFYTYATWNDAARDSNDINTWKGIGFAQAFGDKTSGGVLGIQAEGWW